MKTPRTMTAAEAVEAAPRMTSMRAPRTRAERDLYLSISRGLSAALYIEAVAAGAIYVNGWAGFACEEKAVRLARQAVRDLLAVVPELGE